MTMYFDDVSRHAWRWSPGAKFPTVQVSHQTQVFPSESTLKLDAVQRMLLGYNAESASKLSSEEGKL